MEVGCEGGRWSKLLADLGWNLICTDIDPDSLKVCQSRVPAARCVQVSPDAAVLPAETSALDLLLCLEVFPVIESDWFPAESYRVLRPGGTLVGVFLNRHSLRGLVGHYLTEPFQKNSVFRHYNHSYGRWKAGLRKTGFDVTYEYGYCWAPFTRQSNSPFVSLFIRFERAFQLWRLPELSPWIVFNARKRPIGAGGK